MGIIMVGTWTTKRRDALNSGLNVGRGKVHDGSCRGKDPEGGLENLGYLCR